MEALRIQGDIMPSCPTLAELEKLLERLLKGFPIKELQLLCARLDPSFSSAHSLARSVQDHEAGSLGIGKEDLMAKVLGHKNLVRSMAGLISVLIVGEVLVVHEVNCLWTLAARLAVVGLAL